MGNWGRNNRSAMQILGWATLASEERAMGPTEASGDV